MSRAARTTSEKILRVAVGETDISSKAARSAAVPLCKAIDPQEFHASQAEVRCTRAAGHNESFPGHPSTDHVATGVGFIVLAVW